MGKLQDRPALSSVGERDIDILLLLAAKTIPDFPRFLAHHVTGETEISVEGAWHSAVTEHGESDLLMLFRTKHDRLALLIEDKIDAVFQPDQVDRYYKRGEQGIRDGDWDRYRACLILPASRLTEDDLNTWHAVIALEQLYGWFSERITADPLCAFIAEALNLAIHKYEGGGFVFDQVATSFWQKYKQFCAKYYPNVRIDGLSDRQSRHDPWPQFSKDRLPGTVRLEHKARKGAVDLTLKMQSVDHVKERLQPLLMRTTLGVVQTSPSVALRFQVSPMSPMDPFELQEDKARQALTAVCDILTLWPEIYRLLWQESN